jgi:hypothetical protein
MDWGEVMIKDEMMNRIERDVIRMEEKEKWGMRGWNILIKLENEKVWRRIGKIKCEKSKV